MTTVLGTKSAIVGAILALFAPASQAATFQSTFTDFNSQLIGGALAFESRDTFELTNNTGATWRSFSIETSPLGVSFSNYVGPGYADKRFSGRLGIFNISIADGDILTFTITSASNSPSWTFSGQPSEDAVVPLPAAAWMMLAGLGGLGAVARTRRS